MSNINQLLYWFEKVPYLLHWKLGRTLLRPWFFCVSTFPETEEYKISVPWTFDKEIKKNFAFLAIKNGGSTYTRVTTVINLYLLLRLSVLTENVKVIPFNTDLKGPLKELWLIVSIFEDL